MIIDKQTETAAILTADKNDAQAVSDSLMPLEQLKSE
jgi:hypothetical protein